MNKWTAIVIHHAGQKDYPAFDVGGIRKYHMNPPPTGNGWQDVGYHYLVDLVGDGYEVVLGRPLTRDGAHAPDNGYNKKGIGVCLVGNFNLGPPPDAMLKVAAERLIIPLMDIFKIPKSAIIGHKDTGKITDCPGTQFDLGRLLAMV